MGNTWKSRQPHRDKHALKRIRLRYDEWKSKYSYNVSNRIESPEYLWSEERVKKWFESLPRTIADREKSFVKGGKYE